MFKRFLFTVSTLAISYAWQPHITSAATSVFPPVLYVESQQAISVNAGQYFMIALPSNRTTGFSWSYAHFVRPGVAQMVGSAYSAPGGAVAGIGGKEILLFRALVPGATRLTLGYRRPWEKKPPARTVAFNITISSASEAASTLPCVRTRLATIRMPVGPAEYQSGRLTLQNGASLRVSGTPAPQMVHDFHAGDPIVACYGSERNWADAPRSRSTTVLDLRSGSFFGSLIGEWPGASLINH